MPKRKAKLYILFVFLVLFYSLYSSNALEYSQNMNGPLGTWFDLTIDILDTELETGDHEILLELIVADFGGGTSINSTVIELSLRDSVEVYSTSQYMGNFTPAQASGFANTTFMYQDYWGDVTLYLKIKFIYQRPLYTSTVMDTGWFSFVDLYPASNQTTERPTPWGLYIGLIVVGILALFGVIIFFSYRFYMKPTPDYVPQPKQQLVEKSSFKPIIEKQETIKKLKQEKTIPLIGEYCSYCGYKADPKSKFCISCGKTLERK
ncbi:MAG: zinc ribbon domain-containing protein [Candidatus Heimdallarchaeota archaeon]|nr:zinc ribbon domain-containing protein [Candidatus Heimdallarchaeota archaeon]MCK4769423.1 zinc ribbon domain-containing protein [Candidatus Heimdallarchaeota archaeon]